MGDNPGCTRRDFLRGAITLASVGFYASAADARGGAPVPSMPSREIIYPDDAFSRPAIDRLPVFATLSGCSIAGGVVDRAARFAENKLSLAGTRTLWRFSSRDAASTALIIDERIRRSPESASFHIKNASAEPVTVSLGVNELAWLPVRENLAVNWTLGQGQTVAAGERKELTFRFSEASPTSQTDRKAPRYPLFGIVITASGIKTGVPYEIVLSDLVVRYPDAAGISVTRLECDSPLKAGRDAAFGLAVAGSAENRVIDLEVRREAHVMWRIRLSSAETTALGEGPLEIRRRVPWYLAAGRYSAGIVVDGYRAPGPECSVEVANVARPPLPMAERRLYNGRPTFFLDGKPRAWQGYASYDYQPGSVADFGANGATVFCVTACAGKHVHNVCDATIVAPDRHDYGGLDERVSFSLQANPNALIFLRVSLALPRFWSDQHQSELARVRTDQGDLIWEETGTPAPSLASELWRRDQAEALRDLVRHCKSQPWAGRLAGFLLTCEVTEEWFAWGCNDGLYSDYSHPNQSRFAKWMADQGLPTAQIPPPGVRKCAGSDVYPDTTDGRLAASYNQYASELTVDTIGFFAEVVKRETENSSLVGAFYGYVIQLSGEPRQVLAGHSALRKVLDDPSIDFICGIPLLDFRDLTNGYNPYTSATDSILAAGKLLCNENDMFSWLHPILWHTEFDPADPRAAAISMHRRECANDAVHGVVSQKFSLMASWHHDAALQADFALQAKVNARALNYDRTPAEEIAFVVDESTLDWTPPEAKLPGVAHKQLLRNLGRTGAPVGVWLLSDLDRLPERVKLVVIPHAVAPKPDDITKLRPLIQRGGRTLLICGPVGLVDRASGRWDPGAPADILGLPISVTEGRTTGEAARDLRNGGRLIWRGTADLSTDQLRQMIERAGVHCYAPKGCFVHASFELVAITSPAGAEVVVHWPSKCSTIDLFDGWRGSGTSIKCPFAAGQTRLFAVKPI